MLTKEQAQNIDSIAAIDKLPDAILVDRDYDVLHTLVSIGLIDSQDGDGTEESEAWDQFWAQDYQGLFVLLDDSGADYLAVWGFSGSIPWLEESLDLLWFDNELL